MIKVSEAGALCTVQGSSRRGVAHLGVCRAGPLDSSAAALANLLLGNPPQAACLELIAGPLRLECTQTQWLCVTGTGFVLSVEPGQQRVNAGWPIQLQAGESLLLNNSQSSGTAYIAVAGGFAVPRVLHSTSTDLAAGFGGLEGRTLRRGDTLVVTALRQQETCAYHRYGVQRPSAPPLLRAIPGPEHDLLDPQRREQFWRGRWLLSTQFNRMGCRLQPHTPVANPDTAAAPQALGKLASHAVLPGTVQWPADGQPLVLLADAQTTGGYPRVASVIQADLWRLAQLPRNSTIRFERCTEVQAVAALRQQRAQLYRFTLALAKARGNLAAGSN
ncbi:MAG: biotin-dependent carboxyltransferase family protein [Pseudomonadales bacterium]|nr:biotin-dependent carboxyltransferase family protein [Gammaproteobacteria bacterium]NNL57736.1 biotin-dependent carboxyltransferase family protein [Pseudomonadales bacterium]